MNIIDLVATYFDTLRLACHTSKGFVQAAVVLGRTFSDMALSTRSNSGRLVKGLARVDALADDPEDSATDLVADAFLFGERPLRAFLGASLGGAITVAG
ncbi:hypothetical protein PS15p_202625 [Mucor circinelloides]